MIYIYIYLILLKQNISTGETPDGELPKTIILDMVPLLDDPYIR